jgi:hypothetical protein
MLKRVKPSDKIMKNRKKNLNMNELNWLFSGKIVYLDFKCPLYIQKVLVATRDSFENWNNNILIFESHSTANQYLDFPF